MSRAAEQVGCGGNDEHQVGLLPKPHVRNLVHVIEQVDADRLPDSAAQVGAPTNFNAACGSHHSDVVVRLGEQPKTSHAL